MQLGTDCLCVILKPVNGLHEGLFQAILRNSLSVLMAIGCARLGYPYPFGDFGAYVRWAALGTEVRLLLGS
jgi:hypothetical protein